MSITAVREYVSLLWKEYQGAKRKRRSEILSELSHNLKRHRKSAILHAIAPEGSFPTSTPSELLLDFIGPLDAMKVIFEGGTPAEVYDRLKTEIKPGCGAPSPGGSPLARMLAG